MSKKRFNFRSFVSFTVFFQFIFLVVTGIVLFIAPHGRTAHWVNWHFLGFTKTQWEEFHTILGYSFLIFIVIHIYYNWRVIVGYLKNNIKRELKITKELTLSFIFIFTILFIAGMNLPPASWVMDIGEKATESWDKLIEELPVPHAELFTVKKLAKEINLDYAVAVKRLKNANIKFKENETLKEIAENNNSTPQKIYNIMTKNNSSESLNKNMGYGRMAILEIARKLNKDEIEIIKFLKNSGFKKIKKGDRLKDITDNNPDKDYTPYKLYLFIIENSK